MAALLALCLLLTVQTETRAQGSIVFTVTNTGDSGAGSLRAAIDAANSVPSSDFTIVLDITGTIAPGEKPVLDITGRNGKIQGSHDAVMTGFRCNILGGGSLTLENVNIDNSGYGFTAINLPTSDNTLFLSGNNHINSGSYGIFLMNSHLTIDKAPGGTDMNSTLTLTDESTGIFGLSGCALTVKGGSIEANGTGYGITTKVTVVGGKVVATGNNVGIYSPPMIQPEINGGTVVAHGSYYDIQTSLSTVIRGGSVNARKFLSPVFDGSGQSAYLVTVTVGETPIQDTEVSCTVNGGAAFTAITDEEGKLYLWMPEGQGNTEIDVGGTIYRASGPVEDNNDNVMRALPPAVVTGVVVTPIYTTALTGMTVQFSALVEGLYSPPQTVTWKVENGHLGTNISNTGLLRIAPRETSTNLLVTATSTYDSSRSATAQIAVLSVIGIIIGVVFLFLLLVLLAVFLEVRNPFQRR